MNAAKYSRKDRNGYTSTREPLRFTARKPQAPKIGEITEYGICGLQIEVATEAQAEKVVKACTDRRWAAYAVESRGLVNALADRIARSREVAS